MSKIQGKKRIAATYRVKEPIENFLLRIKVAQRRSLLADLLEAEDDTRDSNYLEEENRIFRWQEKVFSPFERDFYSDEKNCLTDSQRNYHQRIKAECSNVSPGEMRLYTYTQTDSYFPEKNLFTRPYESHLSLRNQSALPAIQNRKPFAERYNKVVLEERLTDARIQTNHYFYMERSSMYVLADLSRKDVPSANAASDVDSETLLCVVTYDRAHKLLTIDPDFTTNECCYTITNSSGIKYDYWIEHASEKPSASELKKQREELRREVQQLLTYKAAEMPNEVQLTSPNTLRIFLNMDIISAHDFSYNALFITYYIMLPEDWTTDEEEKLVGRTQKCYMKNGSAHFSYAVDMSLDVNLNVLNAKMAMKSWPSILLFVASLDSWTRCRTEGYGTLAIPMSVGTYQFFVPTWRPIGNIIDSFRRFFTGGTCELEDITFCDIPANHKAATLDKSNLNVVPSGRIRINLNLIHQSNVLTRNFNFKHGHFERLMNNVESVFEQFRVARERMLQIKSTNL